MRSSCELVTVWFLAYSLLPYLILFWHSAASHKVTEMTSVNESGKKPVIKNSSGREKEYNEITKRERERERSKSNYVDNIDCHRLFHVE